MYLKNYILSWIRMHSAFEKLTWEIKKELVYKDSIFLQYIKMPDISLDNSLIIIFFNLGQFFYWKTFKHTLGYFKMNCLFTVLFFESIFQVEKNVIFWYFKNICQYIIVNKNFNFIKMFNLSWTGPTLIISCCERLFTTVSVTWVKTNIIL